MVTNKWLNGGTEVVRDIHWQATRYRVQIADESNSIMNAKLPNLSVNYGSVY